MKYLRTSVIVTFSALLLIVTAAPFAAQDAARDAKPTDSKPASETLPPKEETSVTDHTIRLGGQTIPYKATAGTILLKDAKDEPTALMFYTAYVRSDVKDTSERPVAFLYNGGPGAASIWLHMGAFGPYRVATANAAATPPPPYQLADNPNTLLDKADMVFIDPVGTGYSHAVGKAQDKDFWGVDPDVRSMAQFIQHYVSQNNRWNSPKFLIGESYGTFRSAALAQYLQSHEHMAINGIVLISTVLDGGTISFPPGEDLAYVLYLPSYAAAAWYHKVLKDRPEDLQAFLEDARQFSGGEYATALMKGSKLSEDEKAAIAKKLSYFTGLSEDYFIRANLRVILPEYLAELQRSRGLTTGRIDARFTAPMLDRLEENAENDPQLDAISGAFTAAFNTYVRSDLKFNQDRTYEPLSGPVDSGWEWKHQGSDFYGFPGEPNVENDLVQAMTSNPHLQVQVENGYFDLATPFFATEYTMDHLNLPESLQSHIHMEYYESGHMMYLSDSELTKLKTNISGFIDHAAKP
jgi:carboxypeptidase C (cathepsin A)